MTTPCCGGNSKSRFARGTRELLSMRMTFGYGVLVQSIQKSPAATLRAELIAPFKIRAPTVESSKKVKRSRSQCHLTGKGRKNYGERLRRSPSQGP